MKMTADLGWAHGIWVWTPDQGRWEPACDRPREPVSLESATGGLAVYEAYDRWREAIFYCFDADRHDRAALGDYHAKVRSLISDVAEFYHYQSQAVSGRRANTHLHADGGDNLDIGLVLPGHRRHRQESDTALVVSPGEFFVYDVARPSRVGWDTHQGAHLVLRRSMLEAALGSEVPPASLVMQALTTSHLTPFLKSQFILLARHMGNLTIEERAILLRQTLDLVRFMLQDLSVVHGASEQTPNRRGLFVAAQRHIENHLADPELNAAWIAQVLGCSRATLYRAFVDHDRTVAGMIREWRLLRAHRMLKKASSHLAIGDIASCCGFMDRRNFNRLFRERFGQRPSDIASKKSPVG